MVLANHSSEIFYITKRKVEFEFCSVNQCFSTTVSTTYSTGIYPGEVRSVVETLPIGDPVYGRVKSLETRVEGYLSSGKPIALSSGKVYF